MDRIICGGEKPSDFRDTSDEVIDNADIKKVRDLFKAVDDSVEKFLDEYGGRWFETIAREVEWKDTPMETTPLFLISHTMTHEFHHRGQILSIARLLGYPSTDDRLGSLFS